MNSNNKLNSNHLPLLFIDVGTDNVKFTQPVLNSYLLSNILREEISKKTLIGK